MRSIVIRVRYKPAAMQRAWMDHHRFTSLAISTRETSHKLGIQLSRAEMKQLWNELDWENNVEADNPHAKVKHQNKIQSLSSADVDGVRKEFVVSQIMIGGDFEGQLEQCLKLTDHLDTAVDILQDWHQIWKQNPTLCKKPIFSAYSGVMFRLQMESGYHAAEQAAKILTLLVEMIDNFGMVVENGPLKNLYEIVIQLYSPNIAPPSKGILDVGILTQSAKKADVWLRALEDCQDVRSKHMIPHKRLSYTAILSGYARAALAIKTELKKSMPDERDALAYTALINAHAANQLLLHMETRHSFGKTLAPNIYCYKAVLTAWSTIPTLEAANQAHATMFKMDAQVGRIDDKSFSTVLQALGTVTSTKPYHPDDDSHPAAKALQTLFQMEDRRRNGQEILQLVRNFNVVIRALGRARMPEGEDFGPLAPAPLATSLTLRLQSEFEMGTISQGPDIFTNGGMIIVWSHHPNRNEAVEYLEVTLEQMERLLKEKYWVDPGIITMWFSAALGAIAKSTLPDAPQRCEAILDRRTSYHIHRKHEYIATIMAWANPDNLNLKDRALNARRILKRVPRPSHECYTAVMRACAHDDDVSTALSIAEEIFQEAPVHFSIFGGMMEVYIEQLPAGKERDMKLRQVFDKACKEGCVHSYVTTKLQEGASQSLLVELMGEAKAMKLAEQNVLSRGDLAEEWTCNVLEAKQHLTKASN